MENPRVREDLLASKMYRKKAWRKKKRHVYKSALEQLNMWEELKLRWKTESPSFWKKIFNTSVAIGSSAVAVISADQLFGLQAYGIPQIIFTIAGYIIVACAAVGLSAKITKQ